MVSRTDRIIFLDIDGVLNNPSCYQKASGSCALADPACVAALNHITDVTRAVIVVSSTWRRSGLLRCRENLAHWGVTGWVIDRTPILKDLTRGAEIAEWLDRYPLDLDSYVILDDDADAGTLKARLVRTDYQVGLTMDNAERAIQILLTKLLNAAD